MVPVSRFKTLDNCRFIKVSAPTPLKDNDCPDPPEELVINEVGPVSSGVMHLPANFYVELSGPSSTELHSLIVVLFEVGGVRHIIPLKGRIADNGLYVLGNVSTAGEFEFVFFVFFFISPCHCLALVRSFRLSGSCRL